MFVGIMFTIVFSEFCCFFVFFFFQAEDGIRDLTVTGVQTCALPIWSTTRTDPPKMAGRLGGTPAGHAAIFGGSVLVVDLVPQPVIRGLFPVPAVRPARPTPATVALDRAAAEVVGESRHTWVGRTGARHYLPDLVARALREATGTPAGFVPAAQHTTQGALDGAVAALSAGPVTQLDLLRLFGYLDDRLAVVPL